MLLECELLFTFVFGSVV